jgi:potassium-transporting ATPase KdpC subunit
MFKRQLKIAVLMFLALTVLTGVVYPLLVTALSQLIFPWRANGSLIRVQDRVVGSELLGQGFTDPKYFQSRPSAVDYNAAGSGASNYGPTSQRLMDLVKGRVEQVRRDNGLAENVPVPADLVTASGSGLDPHISLEGALLQVHRIAKQRNLDPERLAHWVKNSSRPTWLGTGLDRVNVLKLNVALDTLHLP